MSTNENAEVQTEPQLSLAEELHAKDMEELAEEAASQDITEETKSYFPPMGNGEFAMNCLGAAWNVVTDGILNIMASDSPEETKKLAVINLLQPLRTSHIKTVQHTADFVDNYEYHVMQQRNLDGVVEFILHDQIIGIKNNYSGIPRASLVDRNPETDKDPNWRYDALPFERIFRGERIPVKVQTSTQTIYGYLECLNHQVPNPADPTKLINVQTTVPCIRVKKGQVPPNSAWRWQEVTEERLKSHWIRGEDIVVYVPPKSKAKAEANPIEKAPETKGTENGNVTEPSDSIANDNS